MDLMAVGGGMRLLTLRICESDPVTKPGAFFFLKGKCNMSDDDPLHELNGQPSTISKDSGLQIGKGAMGAIPFAQRLSCTISEACSVTGLGRTKLYELIGAGSVETTCIGRRRLVSVKSLLHLIVPTRVK